MYKFINILANVDGITPPTNIKNEPWESWLNVFLIASIFLLILVIFLCSMLYLKNKTIKTLEKKCCPIIFTNNETKDILLISNDNYVSVSIQFSLYDENKTLQKQYVLNETNIKINEQRKIGNINDLGNFLIQYKIVSFVRKVNL